MHSFSAISANIAINDILLKLDSLDLNYIYRSVFNHFDVIGPKPTEFVKIRQNNGTRVLLEYSFMFTLVQKA